MNTSFKTAFGLAAMLMAGMASAETPSGIESLAQVHQQIRSDFELEHYFVSLITDADEIEALSQASQKCYDSAEFVSVSAERASQLLISPLSDTYFQLKESGAIDADDGYSSALEEMVALGEQIESELTGRRVSVCEEQSRPAYSDSRVTTFFEIDGEVMAVQDVGFPD